MRNNCANQTGFLSTLPARGATRGLLASCTPASHFYPRSPRGERLVRIQPYMHEVRNFYPRSPRGERRAQVRLCGGFCPISIHAPREGSDHNFNFALIVEQAISIHAPREGSDGVDGSVNDGGTGFLSTLPARGATAKPNKNTAGFCAKGPNADLGCTKWEGQFCAISMIFLRAGAVRRGFAGANLPVGPCALGLRTGGGRRPDYTSSTSSWDHCGARPMCSTRVL